MPRYVKFAFLVLPFGDISRITTPFLKHKATVFYGIPLGSMNTIITRRLTKNGKVLVTLTKKIFLVSKFKI